MGINSRRTIAELLEAWDKAMEVPVFFIDGKGTIQCPHCARIFNISIIQTSFSPFITCGCGKDFKIRTPTMVEKIVAKTALEEQELNDID